MAALVLLGWASTGLISTGVPGAHTLATLSPAVTLLALVVIAISAGRRAVVPGGLALVAAIVPWLFAAGYAGAGPGPTAAAPGLRSLRLVHVHAEGGQADADSVTAMTRSQAADVVVVTGLSDTLSHDLAEAGFTRLVTPRWVSTTRDAATGIGVFSRQGTASLELVPGTPAPVARGTLVTPAGEVDLIVAQSPGGPLSAGADARRTLSTLAELPATTRNRVLVGDLDATPWHGGFRALQAQGWHDAADVVGRGLRPTWPAGSPLPFSPANHVLVGEGVGAESAETVRVAGSQHRAIVVSLLLPSD